jgi:hypothetical protein
MDDYIVINGKKAELTGEQLKALGIEDELARNNPFGKIIDNSYYYITSTDRINFTENIDSVVDEDLYNNTNFLRIPEYNKLTINAKSIKINDDKISITIDKDKIDKFNAIEINGVKFVKEDN